MRKISLATNTLSLESFTVQEAVYSPSAVAGPTDDNTAWRDCTYTPVCPSDPSGTSA
jgi:hypothetical protein